MTISSMYSLTMKADERTAAIALLQHGITATHFRALITKHGSAAGALRTVIPEGLIGTEYTDALEQARETLNSYLTNGTFVDTVNNSGYPHNLPNVFDYPPIVFGKELNARKITTPSQLSEHVTLPNQPLL